MNAVNEWLYVATISIGFVLVGLAIFVGVGMLVAPDRMRSTASASNQKYSLRKALKPLEIPRHTDRVIYRHHRIAGSLLALAAAAFLYVYLTDSPQLQISGWLAARLGTAAFSSTLAGLGGFLAVVNFLALLLGVVLAVRPSALKPLENVANLWVSTRQATRPLDKEYGQLDTLAWRMPRLTGIIILLAGSFIMVNLFQILIETGTR